MTILVTGATGNIGRMVVDHLLARGATGVRALTVDPPKADLPDGVEAARGSVRRPDSLAAALDGVDRMYLAPYPATVSDVLARARDAGVRHVVDLSGEPESWWGSVNDAVEAAGVGWTHLWPADFMENVRMWLPQIRECGEVREPWPEATSAPTAMDDIAEVAAVALLEDGHEGRSYSLRGPAGVSRREMVAAIAEATGMPIGFVPSTPEETARALEPAMGPTASWYVENVLTGLAGGHMQPNTLVADVTGRPATTFAAWATAHADDLRAAITP